MNVKNGDFKVLNGLIWLFITRSVTISFFFERALSVSYTHPAMFPSCNYVAKCV
jgi:hypothetical protein